jgi:glycine betaine catabolism A
VVSTTEPRATAVDERIPTRYRLGSTFVPKGRYLDREILDREYRNLFPRVWQVACRAEELHDVGQYVNYEIGDQSIVVVRTREGIRAYFNACRHRGTRLCTGSGRIGDFRCPFHGWRWHLDGSIKLVLDQDEFDPRTDDDLGLQPVRVDTWGGWVYVNMDLDAPPLLEWLDPLPERLAPYHIDHMRATWWKQTVMPCNWKTALDAFNEAYHVPGTHPQLLRGADRTNVRVASLDELRHLAVAYPTECFENHAKFRTELRDAAGRPAGDSARTARMGATDVESFIAGLEFSYLDDLKALRCDLDLRAAYRMREVPPPEGVPLPVHYANVRREMAEAEGFEWTVLTPQQMSNAETDWHVFPNQVFLITQGSLLGYRTRPNGLDPDSCIFEAYALEQQPVSKLADRHDVVHTVVEDWHDHDGWGQILPQDFRNMGEVTAGMHSLSFEGHHLSRETEMTVRHHHEVADRYLWRDETGGSDD